MKNNLTKILAVSAISIAIATFSSIAFAETTDFVPSLGPTDPTPSIVGSNTVEVAITPTTSNSDNAEGSTTLTPTTGGSNGAEASTTLVPSVGGSNNAEGSTTLTPTTGGSNGDEGGTTLVPTNIGSNGDETSTTTATTTPDNGGNGGNGGNPNSSSGGNGGGSFGGSGGSPLLISSVIGSTTIDLNTCPLLTDFLQLGGINSTAQVFKLQAFLKEIEGINVNFTGVFDSNTELAVKTFQAKYLADIMGPWKSNTPSGIVYITTKKKINEIACKSSSLTLTPAELATISTYLANLQNGSTTAPTIENGTGTTTGTTSPLIGGANDNSANTASVINANILQRIWNFLKSIF